MEPGRGESTTASSEADHLQGISLFEGLGLQGIQSSYWWGGATILADIAHPAGLIAAKTTQWSRFPICHIVTSTTHKTLRGPRGGIVMIGQDFENLIGKTTKGKTIMMSTLINSAVFQVSRADHLNILLAAKGHRFGSHRGFVGYARQVVANA